MIEQAKEISAKLRHMARYPNVRISPSDPETQKEAAGVIDALVLEVERLTKVEPPRFPTMLRKMWSGREVQEWINENWGKQ